MENKMFTKSLTIPSSGTSTINNIETNVFKESPMLSALGNETLSAKTTYKPFTKPQEQGVASFVIDGLVTTKEILTTTPATITDETIEDTAVDIAAALQDTLESIIRGTLEAKVVSNVKAAIVATVSTQPTALASILELLKSFNQKVFITKGTIKVLVSYNTYLDLTSDIKKINSNMAELAPSAYVLDEDIIALHPHGYTLGFSLKDIERKRSPSIGASTLIATGTLGTAFSTYYVKRATY